MDLPAVIQGSDGSIILTSADLAAGDVAEDVQYAYIMNRTEFRLGDPGARPAGDGASGQMPVEAEAPEDRPTAAPEPVLTEMEGYAVSPEFFDAWGLQTAQGSLFTESDMTNGKPLLILGSDLAQVLFEDGQSLGRQVPANFELYEIVGVLEPTGETYDDMAFTPALWPTPRA